MLGDGAAEFLRGQLAVREFAACTILHGEFLQLIPTVEERKRYVAAVILKHGAWNWCWIRASLEVGIEPYWIGELIISRLQEVTERELNDADFCWDFMRRGESAHDRMEHTPWGVMDDAQFERVIRVCAEKAPADIIAKCDRLAKRIKPDKLQEIVASAVGQLDHVCAPEILKSVPLETRKELAKRLKPPTFDAGVKLTTQFLVELALELDENEKTSDEFITALFRQKLVTCAATVFATGMPVLAAARGAGKVSARRASLIDDLLHEILFGAGYLVGHVTEGTYYDRKSGRDRKQVQVVVNGVTFVQDRRQRDYYPHVGDAVVFRPVGGHRLTPRVVAVHFTKVAHIPRG